MSENNVGLYWMFGICSVIILISVIAVQPQSFLSEQDLKDSEARIVAEVLSSLPDQVKAEDVAALVKIPKVESADNELLNEFLEGEFSEEYNEIKDAAESDAVDELEKKDYRVVLNYLKDLVEGLDENSMDVDVNDVEVKVLKLGLEDESDKCASVTFELEVEYELEEGVRDEFEKDLVLVYDVCYDEGDFSDEDVELVSIQ